MVRNLYVHFPFCRRKCSYCALHSRAGVSQADRDTYVRRLADEIGRCASVGPGSLSTVYFGGGSPGLCDLQPLFDALGPLRTSDCEFTVELHPLDVSEERLRALKAGGVNRISMGVQALDDAILADMGRGYAFSDAERAFYLVKEHFDNAGIDLIVGYPGETAALVPRHARLAKWGLRHCSVYSLILEERSLLSRRMSREDALRSRLPTDDETLNRLAVVARFLSDLGLERYEISNYAEPGFECRHNLAVWRGEDYFGLGEGAHGRIGLDRTESGRTVETLTPERDEIERRIFRLRTREGLDAAGHPEWEKALGKFVDEGLLTQSGQFYRLTPRGAEVCDSMLVELVCS